MEEAALILVVDDKPENRELLGRRLKQLGHRVEFAEDGAQALSRIQASRYDLVLLDIMMPQVDGYQVLERLKSDGRLAEMPVIVVSAVTETESVVRCIELGAEDYLVKPFNPVLLRARVGASLERKRLRDRDRELLAQLRTEKERSERLLLSIFPKAVADRLRAGEEAEIAENFPEASVLFADLNDFSRVSAIRPAHEVVKLLNTFFSAFDALAERHGVEKIKTIADAYLAVAGLPTPRPDHAEAVAELALSMQSAVARIDAGPLGPFSLRVGIHSGPVVAGVIGTTKFAYDLWGETVNLAAEMESYGLPGSIQVTAATYQRLRDKYLFEERGAFYVKNRGEIETYLLRGRMRTREGGG